MCNSRHYKHGTPGGVRAVCALITINMEPLTGFVPFVP